MGYIYVFNVCLVVVYDFITRGFGFRADSVVYWDIMMMGFTGSGRKTFRLQDRVKFSFTQ